MSVTENPTVGDNVTPEEAAARLAEIKAKKWISWEEWCWVFDARDAGLLPPLTPEEEDAERRFREITKDAGRYSKEGKPLRGAQRAWIARMRKKGLLLPPTKSNDPSKHPPWFDEKRPNIRAEFRAAERQQARDQYQRWLAKQPPEVQAEQAAVRRFNYLFHAWKQFERAWRNAPSENKRKMLTAWPGIEQDLAAILREIRELHHLGNSDRENRP